ncbi:hypothetical protein ES708_31080 [subsurface metagenome]
MACIFNFILGIYGSFCGTNNLNSIFYIFKWYTKKIQYEKIILLLLILICSINLFAQISFKTGDIELETDLNKINAKAKVDFGAFKAEMATTYNIEEKKIEYMRAEVVMEPAEIYLALEIGRIANKPIDEVIEVYKIHKGKGWGFIAKKLGIKPGSDEFHMLKNDTHNHKYTSTSDKPSDSKNKGKGKEKNKDKGKNK